VPGSEPGIRPRRPPAASARGIRPPLCAPVTLR